MLWDVLGRPLPPGHVAALLTAEEAGAQALTWCRRAQASRGSPAPGRGPQAVRPAKHSGDAEAQASEGHRLLLHPMPRPLGFQSAQHRRPLGGWWLEGCAT